jgi:SynChlorMet cassette radical SAM/SPASM protein ScmF
MPASPARTTASQDSVPPLKSIFFYLTHECNQACIHCWINPAREGRYRAELPSFDQYCGLIDAARPMGLSFVKLTGGEPLLRAETLPLVEYLSAAGIRTALETNAMLVGPREAELLAEHRVTVSVSLDGASAEVHDRRRGLRGAFERSWRALELLTEAGVPLTVITAVSRSNRDEIPKVLERLRSLPKKARLDLKINPILPIGRAQKLGLRGDTLSPPDLLALVAQVCEELIPRYEEHGIGIVLQLELTYFPIESLMRGAAKAGVCHCGFLNLLSVLADGSITLCGIGYQEPELTMGNLREPYDLPSLWQHHPVLERVRDTVHNALEGVCRHCLFQSLCLGGCRASALAVGGSLAASPPSCQALYDAGLFPVSRLVEPAASEYTALAPTLSQQDGATGFRPEVVS